MKLILLSCRKEYKLHMITVYVTFSVIINWTIPISSRLSSVRQSIFLFRNKVKWIVLLLLSVILVIYFLFILSIKGNTSLKCIGKQVYGFRTSVGDPNRRSPDGIKRTGCDIWGEFYFNPVRGRTCHVDSSRGLGYLCNLIIIQIIPFPFNYPRTVRCCMILLFTVWCYRRKES